MIAITGGIGSGKSVVSEVLRIMGYRVYDCDREAKRLMNTDPQLRAQLCEAFGAESYLPDGSLNKPFIAKLIFSDPGNLLRINNLVHPAVAADCIASGCDFVESAILFEAHFDEMIHPGQVWCVAAPDELRIERCMLRDNATREQILARMNNQLSQEEKTKRSDNVIWNDADHSIIEQINRLMVDRR